MKNNKKAGTENRKKIIVVIKADPTVNVKEKNQRKTADRGGLRAVNAHAHNAKAPSVHECWKENKKRHIKRTIACSLSKFFISLAEEQGVAAYWNRNSNNKFTKRESVTWSLMKLTRVGLEKNEIGIETC